MPPNQFLWINPNTIDNGILFWEDTAQSFEQNDKEWLLNIGLIPIGLKLDYGNKNPSLFQLIRNGHITPEPVIQSIIYWTAISIIIIFGVYFLSIKRSTFEKIKIPKRW